MAGASPISFAAALSCGRGPLITWLSPLAKRIEVLGLVRMLIVREKRALSRPIGFVEVLENFTRRPRGRYPAKLEAPTAAKGIPSKAATLAACPADQRWKRGLQRLVVEIASRTYRRIDGFLMAFGRMSASFWTGTLN